MIAAFSKDNYLNVNRPVKKILAQRLENEIYGRFKKWEEIDRCLREDFGWAPIKNGLFRITGPHSSSAFG